MWQQSVEAKRGIDLRLVSCCCRAFRAFLQSFEALRGLKVSQSFVTLTRGCHEVHVGQLLSEGVYISSMHPQSFEALTEGDMRMFRFAHSSIQLRP